MYGLWYPYTGISIPRGGAYKDPYPKYLESILQTSLFKQKQQDIEQVGVALMVMV